MDDSCSSIALDNHYKDFAEVMEKLMRIQLKVALIEAKLAAKKTAGVGQNEGATLARWRKICMNLRRESQ